MTELATNPTITSNPTVPATTPIAPLALGDEFVLPAGENKQSSFVKARVPGAMMREIEVIVQTRAFPYRTYSDLVRHAVQRHLNWLAGLKPPPSVHGQVEAILLVLRDEAMRSDFNKILGQLEKQLGAALNDGQPQRAQELLDAVLEKVNAMPEGQWKDQYLKTIKRRWGYMLRARSIPMLAVDTNNGDGDGDVDGINEGDMQLLSQELAAAGGDGQIPSMGGFDHDNGEGL